MRKTNIIIRLCLMACMACTTEATIASPFPINVTLPNGRVITTKIKGGDTTLSWVTNVNDYTLVVGNDSYYYYGMQLSNGRVGSSGVRADLASPPNGLTKNILPTAAAVQADCVGKLCAGNSLGNRRGLVDEDREEGSPGRKLALSRGTVYNLVIPIRFADHHTRKLPTREDLTVLMNNEGSHSVLCPTGSVRDYYKYTSFGQLDLFSVVTDWVNVTGTEKYWANGNAGRTTLTHTLIRQALTLADRVVDFSQFDKDNNKFIDAIAFLHSGYGAEWGGDGYKNRIWSHKWSLSTGTFTSAEGVKVYDYHISPALWGTSGSNIGHIGVIAHETGHFFGLPDMYDGTVGQGMGSFELMANSWGFTRDQYYPPHMSIYTRVLMGWDTAVAIDANGFYTLSAAADQNPSFPRGYKISKNFPSGEYLLIENRQKLFFDQGFPVSGLVIYHVDTTTTHIREGYPGQSGWPGNGNHYRCAVLAADARYDLEKGANRGDQGDLWVAGSAGISWSQNSNAYLGAFPNLDAYQGGKVYKTYIKISNITASGTTMTFRLRIGLTTPPPTRVPTGPTKSPAPSQTPTQRRPTKNPTSRPTKKPVAACLSKGAACSTGSQCCSRTCSSKKGKLVCA